MSQALALFTMFSELDQFVHTLLVTKRCTLSIYLKAILKVSELHEKTHIL